MRGLLLWGYQRLMLNGLASGQYARAETWLDKIERIEGRSRRVLHNRALIRMALSDYAGAEALLEEQVAAFGELSGLLRALAECGYLAGDREQAVRRLDAALADPDCADRSLLEQRRALAADPARYARAMEGKRVFAEGNAKYAAKDLAGAGDVRGKTGEAEFAGGSHAWFAGFFPYPESTYAICVFIERGGHGYAASMMAGRIIRQLSEEGLL